MLRSSISVSFCFELRLDCRIDWTTRGRMQPMSKSKPGPQVKMDRPLAPWREKLHEIIFEADTFGGKAFDVALLIAICVSIIAVSLETVPGFSKYQAIFNRIEWTVTILFTIEYALRLICVRRPLRYIFSFYGIVDFLSILPTYLQLLGPGPSSFAMVRSLRLLRVFRVLKVVPLLSEAEVLYRAFWLARAKIVVFFAAVLVTVTIMGTLMYEVENRFDENSVFDSIPQSMYWAIVTMTTVGYGDIVPKTDAGKFLSAILILLGYSLIIVPTGFVSAEIVKRDARIISTRSCTHCIAEGHDLDAKYCKYCGEKL